MDNCPYLSTKIWRTFMEKIINNWETILNTIKEEYEISNISFDTWLRPLEIYAIEGNILYLLVPSEQMALSFIKRKYAK